MIQQKKTSMDQSKIEISLSNALVSLVGPFLQLYPIFRPLIWIAGFNTSLMESYVIFNQLNHLYNHILTKWLNRFLQAEHKQPS